MPVMEARRSRSPWLIPLVLGVVRDYQWNSLNQRLRMDFWIGYWNRSGDAVVEWDNGSMALDPGGLILIPPLVWVRRRCRGAFDQWWCHFTIPAQSSSACPIRLPCAGGLGIGLRRCWREAWRHGCQHPATVAAWHAVLGLALTQIPWETAAPDPLDHQISELQADLLAQGLPQIANAVLAKRWGMHEKSLCRRFSRATGCGLQAWLREQRIAQAARALTEGQPVDEVTKRFGFTDRSHFSRLFTRSRGIGPGLFRRLALSGRLVGDLSLKSQRLLK